MGGSDIAVYNLKEMTLDEIKKRIENNEVFDIDQSLFTEANEDVLTNHFFDTTSATKDLF